MRAWSLGLKAQIRSPNATAVATCNGPLSGYLTLAAQLINEKLKGHAFNFGPRAEQNNKVISLLSDLAIQWVLMI